jgi:membrane-associated phospholipid phosphatase
MNILDLNTLALDLVAKDFSDGHAPHNGGPTKTARALAIIHLAARDAYAMVTRGSYLAKLKDPPPKPDGVGAEDGISAALGAGIRACTLLYRDFGAFISDRTADFLSDANPKALRYGDEIAVRWIASRHNDNSSLPQLDWKYSNELGHHRPDPISKSPAMGRNWGRVTPFVLDDVTDVHLCGPPDLDSEPYATAYHDVFTNGRDDIEQRERMYQRHAAIGIFWGYDGSNRLGTPPRLYNQVVVKWDRFRSLLPADQINVLAAVNAAMADAGIAAWYWKYYYDFWRPVVAIREADEGFGPTGKGDGNNRTKGDPFWKPLGAPRSNPIPPLKSGADGDNFTPNFPAYPSGHATFGCACFETFAGLVGKPLDEIHVEDFVSDEFNGVTTDNTGVVRPVWKQSFSLTEAIRQNNHSRIYLGVHWRFDVTGGEWLGKKIAEKAIDAFRPVPP